MQCDNLNGIVILDHQNAPGLAYQSARAIVVKSALVPERFRVGFDVGLCAPIYICSISFLLAAVLALANNRPDLDEKMKKTVVRHPQNRSILLGFQGSATIKKRCELYKLHNGKDIRIMVKKVM